MPTESDLRDLLRDPNPEGRGAIDLDSVLRRTRRRRRPRVVAAQALGSVALVGVLGTAIFVAQPPGQEAAMIAQDTSAGTGETEIQPFANEDARRVGDQCGMPLEPTATDPWSLDLVVASVDATQLTVTATQTIDAGDVPAGRQNSIGALTISRDGVVVASAVVGDITTHFDDGFGRSGFWQGRFDIVPCDGTPLSPGAYEVRPTVLVTVMPGGIEPTTEMLYGAPVTVEIG